MTTDYAQMIRDDFELRDDLETVTVTNNVSGSVVEEVSAASRDLNYRESVSGQVIQFQPIDQVWMMNPDSFESGTEPERGHIITDSGGDEWEILSVRAPKVQGLVILYNAYCRKRLS